MDGSSSLNRRQQIESEFNGVNALAWPIRSIEYVIDNALGVVVNTACTSSDSAMRTCEAGARGIQWVSDRIEPKELLKKIEDGEENLALSYWLDYGIFPEDTRYAVESAKKIGIVVITAAVGGIVLKVGKSALKYIKGLRHVPKKTTASVTTSSLPVVDGIKFDADTAVLTKQKLGKVGYIEKVTIEGDQKASLIFVNYLSQGKGSPHNQVLRKAFRSINEFMEVNGKENLFIQFLPANQQLFNILQRRGFENLGKHPFYLKSYEELLSLTKKHKFPVLRVGRKAKKIALPVIGGSSAAIAAMGSAKAERSSPSIDASQVSQLSTTHIECAINTLHRSTEELIQLNGGFLQEWVQQVTGNNPQLEELQQEVENTGGSKESLPIEKQSYDEVCRRVHKDVSNLAGIVSSFGDSAIANNISLVANTSVSMATEIGGLLGYGKAVTDPFSATLAIVNCIGSLIKGFKKKKKKPGEDPLQKQLHAIFEQLKVLEKQLSKINEKAADILIECKEGFSVVFSTLQHHTWQFKKIKAELEGLNQKVSTQFSFVTQNLEKIFEAVENLQRSNAYTEIMGSFYIFENEEPVDKEMYKKRIRDLKKHAGSISKQTAFNGSEIPFTVRAGDYEFSIQKVFECYNLGSTSSIPNPSLFTMGTLGVIYLTIRQFPSIKAPPLSKICSADIKNMKDLLEEGRKLQHSILDLNTATNQVLVIEEYQKVSKALMDGLIKKLKDIEEERQKEINCSAHELHKSDYKGPEMKAFFNNELKITTTPKGTNWFKGGKDRVYESHGSVFDIREQPAHTQVAISNYKTEVTRRVKASKNRYLTRRSNSFSRNYQNEVDKAGQLEMPWFIFPKNDKGLPALPVPEFIQKVIPEQFRIAASKGLGSFLIEYEISTRNKFVLNLNFKTALNAQIIPIKEMEMDYIQNCFEGPEAIWWYWVGGSYPDKKNQALVKFHHDNGSGTHDWLTRTPVLKAQKGKLDTVKLEQVKVTACSDTYPELQTLLEKHDLSEKRYKIERLVTEFARDNRKLLQDFDKQYQKLVGFFAIGFKDCFDDSNHLLHKVFKELFPFSHWRTLASILKEVDSKKPVLLNDLESFSKQLESLNKLSTYKFPEEKTNNLVLDATLEILQFIINYYEPHAVKWNRWNEATESHEFRDSALVHLGQAVQEINTAVSKVDTPLANKISNSIKKLVDAARNDLNQLSEEDRRLSIEAINPLLKSLGNMITDGN
ncbi:MAG: hypothetical protein S4CHLAM20_10710 [Chlamydiia bacterium]|nr:hypothetical protein [Chlamydiia bacterium]